jgi:hypothetical protein
VKQSEQMYWTKNKELVEQLLEKCHSNRDCDRKLYANVVYMQAVKAGFNPQEMTLISFLEHFVESDIFAHPESVRRMRAKLQEDREELRGENYDKRQVNSQSNARKELGYE